MYIYKQICKWRKLKPKSCIFLLECAKRTFRNHFLENFMILWIHFIIFIFFQVFANFTSMCSNPHFNWSFNTTNYNNSAIWIKHIKLWLVILIICLIILNKDMFWHFFPEKELHLNGKAFKNDYLFSEGAIFSVINYNHHP